MIVGTSLFPLRNAVSGSIGIPEVQVHISAAIVFSFILSYQVLF